MWTTWTVSFISQSSPEMHRKDDILIDSFWTRLHLDMITHCHLFWIINNWTRFWSAATHCGGVVVFLTNQLNGFAPATGCEVAVVLSDYIRDWQSDRLSPAWYPILQVLVALELLCIPTRQNLLSLSFIETQTLYGCAFGLWMAGTAPESLIIILQFLLSLLNRSASPSEVRYMWPPSWPTWPECETKL